MPNGAQLRQDITTFLDNRLGDEQRMLLIFDLVGFKKYNDSFGFACGDALLRRLVEPRRATPIGAPNSKPVVQP